MVCARGSFVCTTSCLFANPACLLCPPLCQAITTLLKTGNESSIDRLLKQIGGFMSEVCRPAGSDIHKMPAVKRFRISTNEARTCYLACPALPRLPLTRSPLLLCCHQIADEFKVVVAEAIKALCLKFPQVRQRG